MVSKATDTGQIVEEFSYGRHVRLQYPVRMRQRKNEFLPSRPVCYLWFNILLTRLPVWLGLYWLCPKLVQIYHLAFPCLMRQWFLLVTYSLWQHV